MCVRAWTVNPNKCLLGILTLDVTIMQLLVSSRRITNDSSYYYVRPVLCSVAKSNATVGYQFIALASGKLFGKQRDFLPVCFSSCSGARHCTKCWLRDVYVGMSGGVS